MCLHWWGAVVDCGLRWCVWACIVRPSSMTGAGCGAVGAPSGAVCTYAPLRKHACVHARLRKCALVRINAQTCVRSCVRTYPRLRLDAFGCARASAPILYYPHPDYFSAIFLDPPLIWNQKRKPPITYGGFLSVEGECLRNFEQNRGP